MSYQKIKNGTLFSHREGVLYVEHAKVIASDGMLAFVRAEKAVEKHYSIPHANVCALLLGPGTSVTQQAAKKMADQGVMFGFVGGGGSPLFVASQSEYRPTEYCQKWVVSWQDDSWRLSTAKKMALARCDFVRKNYEKRGLDLTAIESALTDYKTSIDAAKDNPQLLGFEAVFAKRLYAYHSQVAQTGKFKRNPASGTTDVNHLIDNGNYLAYGIAASVLWVLGVPHAFAVNHGKTRRGALVFDLADVIKDAVLLPVAFEAYALGKKEQEHRVMCLTALDDSKSMKLLFAHMKEWSSI